MTVVPEDVDPAIGEAVTMLRNRFGVDGLRVARQMIDVEIAIFEDAFVGLEDDVLAEDA